MPGMLRVPAEVTSKSPLAPESRSKVLKSLRVWLPLVTWVHPPDGVGVDGRQARGSLVLLSSEMDSPSDAPYRKPLLRHGAHEDGGVVDTVVDFER